MGIAVGADAMTRWMWSLPLDRFTISRLGDSVVVHYANAIQWFYLLFATGWLAFSVLITIVAAGPVEWLFVVLFWLSGIVLAYGAVGASLTTTVVVLADTMTIQCRRLRRGNARPRGWRGRWRPVAPRRPVQEIVARGLGAVVARLRSPRARRGRSGQSLLAIGREGIGRLARAAVAVRPLRLDEIAGLVDVVIVFRIAVHLLVVGLQLPLG